MPKLLLLAISFAFLSANGAELPFELKGFLVEQPKDEIPHGVLAVRYVVNGSSPTSKLYGLSFVRMGSVYSGFPLEISSHGSSGSINKVTKDWIAYKITNQGASPKESYEKILYIPWQPEFKYHDDSLAFESRIAWFTPPTMANLITRPSHNKAEQGAAANP